MSSVQAMEEELQQSVMLSEDQGGYQSTGSTADGSTINARPTAGFDGLSDAPVDDHGRFEESGASLLEDNDSEQDASGEDVDVDAEGEDYDGAFLNQITVDVRANFEDDGENGAVQDDEDDEQAEDEGDDEDEEGIGAFNDRREDEARDVEEAESDISDLASRDEDESDDEEEGAWNEAAAEDEDEEESDPGLPITCQFCKQDEEHDPSEDFETFLACISCSSNAHQQCARDAAAMSEQNNAKRWKCPECQSEEESNVVALVGQDDQKNKEGESRRPSSRHSGIPQNILPSQRGNINPDAHSVFKELVLDEDPMDGSRLLRKRKTSSIEADDAVAPLPKRRRQLLDEAEGIGSDQSRGRTLRLKVSRPPAVTVEKRSRTSMILRLQVRPGNLKEVLARKKRERRQAGNGAPRSARTPAPRSGRAADITPIPIYAMPTPFTSDAYSQPFYSFFDKDTEEAKGKPYGGILSEAEADTSKTLPMPDDRRRFDQSKQRAEDEWRARVLAMQAEADVPFRRPRKISENASQIECIEFGGWEIDTWYAAPYPAEYSRNRVLYICEFCLKYMNSDYVAWRHKLKCATKHPPGDEIYRHASVSIFEVDGRKHPVYCQNLCLLAKLFLGSKTLYYDVEPFLFYVLCEYDECGYHFVGYFSKEKRRSSQNNVSCILTLPIHQRKGYGNLLIDFSYLLTKVEQKTGSPEKPLSDMGLVSYRNYWRLVLCRYLLEVMEAQDEDKRGVSIKGISDETGMTADDVVAGLEGLRALVRDPQTRLYAFRVDLDYCRQYVAKWESKGYVKLNPDALAWTPYVMGRSNAVNFELSPPMNTIAPREDDEAQIQEGPDSIEAKSEPVVNGEKGTSAEGLADGVKATETDGDGEDEAVESIEKVAPEYIASASSEDGSTQCDDAVDPEAWAQAYEDIPASRFEVFPAVSGARRSAGTRQGAKNSSVSRGPSSSARLSGSGTVLRLKLRRASSNGSRRKSGGTGRGPGRWPKGTKKSDYGNAESGPGLPPGWNEKQGRAMEGPDGAEQHGMLEEEEPAQDSVQVYVAKAATNGTGFNDATRSDLDEDGDRFMVEGDVDAEGDEM